MMDLGKQVHSLTCPSCKRKITVRMEQVAREELISCSCKQEIQLKDNQGSVKRSIKDINKGFDDLKKLFK